MAERGSRSVFDSPPEGSSPVPAEYGSLGGPPPARDEQRERRPFRWRPSREGGVEPADEPRTPVSYARTSSEPDAPAPAPAARTTRSATPVGVARASAASSDAAAPAAPTSRKPAPRPAPTRRPAAPPVAARRAEPVPPPPEPAPSPPAEPVRTAVTPVVGDGRRSRVVAPGVPRERIDERGRVRRRTVTEPPTPEPRPAAYLPETVRTRQVVRHLDVTSVFRVSLLFYFLGVIALLLAGVVLWNVATALGTIDSIDKSIKTLFDLKTFTLHPGPVLAYGAAAGVVVMFAGAILNTLIATIFNLISDVTGGIVIRVVSEPDDR